jgi:hypothetical protein
MAGNIARNELDDPRNKKLKDAIEAAMAKDGLDIDGNPLVQEEPEPQAAIGYVTSGIRVLAAEDQIREYLTEITPPDAHKKRFRFESWLLGFATGSVALGIVIILLVLGGLGG